MSLSVDVVITAYGRYDLTASCLRHLAAQTLPHRVILVDNGSLDETATAVAHDFPDVDIVPFPSNQAFAVATNRGVAEGRGDVIVMMNNDVECRPDFLERLVAPFAADPRVGSVASVLLRPGEEHIDSVGLTADPTLACFPRLQGHRASDAGAARPVVTGPAGAAAAYRRAAWDAVDGLDEAIFAYMEDFDLALRLRTAGWKGAVAIDAVAVHVGSATHGHRSARTRRNGGFGRGYLLRRYGLLGSRRAARAIMTEAIVVLGDLALSRDLEALKGRIEGWQAGAGLPRLPSPPSQALDASIGVRESLRRRRGSYRRSFRRTRSRATRPSP